MQQVAGIQSDVISVQLVAATKFYCGDQDFYKNSPVCTRRFVAATSRCDVLLNMSPCVFRPLEAEAAGKNALPKPESAHGESVAPRVSKTSEIFSNLDKAITNI